MRFSRIRAHEQEKKAFAKHICDHDATGHTRCFSLVIDVVVLPFDIVSGRTSTNAVQSIGHSGKKKKNEFIHNVQLILL